MPVVTVYRSRRTLARDYPGGRWSMEWDEYHFDPRPAVAWGAGGYAHGRTEPEPIRVRVPPGRLPVTAAVAVYLRAALGLDPNFRLEATEVAKTTRRDDGPTLFGWGEEAPAVGPYGPARRARPPADDTAPFPHTGAALEAASPDRLRARVAELAAEVIRPTIDAVERARAQLRRAIESGTLDGVCTAQAILDVILADAGRPVPAAGQGGGTEAA